MKLQIGVILLTLPRILVSPLSEKYSGTVLSKAFDYYYHQIPTRTVKISQNFVSRRLGKFLPAVHFFPLEVD